MDKYQSRIDKAARDYNRTKDEKYKKLWYEIINGLNHTKQRSVSTHSSNKTNVRGNSVDKRH